MPADFAWRLQHAAAQAAEAGPTVTPSLERPDAERAPSAGAIESID